MVSKMVERVAIASHNFIFNVASNSKINWHDMPEDYQNTWRRLAKAAIKAMREPSVDMIDVADLKSNPVMIWRAMIDAALKE